MAFKYVPIKYSLSLKHQTLEEFNISELRNLMLFTKIG